VSKALAPDMQVSGIIPNCFGMVPHRHFLFEYMNIEQIKLRCCGLSISHSGGCGFISKFSEKVIYMLDHGANATCEMSMARQVIMNLAY
jgi:hypothetical protein